MIKILGAILIVCGTSAWGISGMLVLKRRCLILTELVNVIGAIRSEITTRLTPVPELISRMTDETAEPVKTFFGNIGDHLGEIGSITLYEIWVNALNNTPALKLLQDEKDALKEIPRALGRYDLEEQRLSLIRTERQFEQFLKRAQDIRERDSRIKGFFGVAAGIFIVLLLI